MNINVIKIGNIVKLSINGKLHQKNCGSSQEADELFRLCLKAKSNPTEENIQNIRLFLNEKVRIALVAGLEHDPDSGDIFLEGFNTPVPETLVDVIKEYHENQYPMDPILNFWKLLMLNPDNEVRKELFDFIKIHDFVLTDKGYMIVYKAVYEKPNKVNPNLKKFAEFVNDKFLFVKNDWGCSPRKYVVYKKSDGYDITKKVTADKWDEKKKNIEILGNLSDLFDSLFNVEEGEKILEFETITSLGPKMTIRLGEVVKQERKSCDANKRLECSNGLHVGSTKYVENFGSGPNKKVLVCLVNPANVIAVPRYDHSKMRVCEYFPFALAKYENGKIRIIEEKYFEHDYCEYEMVELEMLLEKVRANEVPIENAMNSEPEKRPMSELLKIVETRLIDIE